MANKYRGEFEITLGGRQYTLRPTFEAMVEFEEKSGTTTLEALQQAATNSTVSIKAIAAAFYVGIKAGWMDGDGKPPTMAVVGGMIQRGGIVSVIPSYLKFLSNALASDEDLKSQEEAETGKQQGSTQT